MTRASLRRRLSLVAALVLALSCMDDASRLDRHLEAARAYQAEGKWREAQLELKSALKLDPGSAEVNLRLGQLEAAQGRSEDALYYFEEAYRLDPENVAAATGIIGITAFSDLERAKAVWSEIEKRHAADYRVHMAGVNLALAESDVPEALVAALTAAELAPEEPEVHLQLGLVHQARIRQRQMEKQEVADALFEDALQAFERARELASDAEDPATQSLRLRAWVEEVKVQARWPGHDEPLRSTLATALEDLGDAPVAERRELVDLALELGRRRRDRKLVRWALQRKVETDPEDYVAWGDLAKLEQRQTGDGIGVLERLIAERPDDPRAHAMYARMLHLTGDTGQAVAHLKQVAADLDGDVSPVLGRLLELQLKQDDLEGARATQAELLSRHPESSATFQASAELATAEGDLESAVDWLTRWLDRRESLIALRMLGQTQLARGDASSALAAADRALELGRGQEARLRPFFCLRGQALLRKGESSLALRTLRQAARSPGPMMPGCREALVQALYAVGEDDGALRLLERLLAERPSRRAVLLFAAREGERDPDRARTLLEGWLSENPGDAGVQARLVQLELRLGRSQAALDRARAAVEASPDSPELNFLLGRTLASTGRIEEAIAQLERTLERWPSLPAASTLLVQLLGRSGRLAEARETLEKLDVEGALPPAGKVTLARMLMDSGDEEDARTLLEAALEADPESTSAANDLAYLLARRGEDLERATELAQRARGQAPESAQVADTLGWVLHQRGLANAALVQFDEAVDLADPQSPAWATAHYHRALALRDLGRTEEAIRAMERALASGTDFPEADAARAAIQELMKGTG